MSRTTELRRELKDRFHPFLDARGFTRDRGGPMGQGFRKVSEDEVLLVAIQWDKYHRPRFVIDFGRCPATGVELGGTHIGPDEVTTAQVARRGRLQPGTGSSTRSWFCQDRNLLARILGFPKPRRAAEVVDLLIHHYADIERLWATGEASKHVRWNAD